MRQTEQGFLLSIENEQDDDWKGQVVARMWQSRNFNGSFLLPMPLSMTAWLDYFQTQGTQVLTGPKNAILN